MSRRLAAVLLFLVLALPSCLSQPEADREVRAELRRQLSHGFRLFRRPTVDADDLQRMVRAFYKKREFRPAWTDGRGPTGDARALFQALRAAPSEGLELSEYLPERIDSLAKRVDAGWLGPAPAPRDLAALDLKLTRIFFAYASHVSSGRVDPTALPADWHVSKPSTDLVRVLTDAVGAHHVQRTLAGLGPDDPRYVRLRDALARHREWAAAGGWPAVPPGPALKKGSRGPRVVALRSRLAASGDLSGASSNSPIFDPALERAVRDVQGRFGFEPSGVVDAETLRALNVPIERRIEQIELNLERWRWRPSDMGDRYVMVNIPAFALELREHGRPVFESRVVVGKQFSPTPIFSDEITYLVINPYWMVPPSIATQELMPAMREDRSYLERSQIRVYETTGPDAPEVDVGRVNWNHPSSEESTYSFRQEPGPQNPIGHVKFMCPNQFDVYLHDTPAGHLFGESARDFSHGCVRVEHADALAEHLLEGKPHSSLEEIDAAFASIARDSAVKLPRPVPVHLVYWTAWVDDSGRMQFRDDVYGLDAVLARAFGRRGPLV